MRKGQISGILVILAVIMVIGSFQIPVWASEINDAKQEKTNLEKKKEEIDSRISALEQEKNDIINYIEKLDLELNRLTEEIDTLNSDILVATKDLDATKEALKLAKLQEQNQYDTMKKRIKFIYENGEPTFLEILAESESIADFLNQVEFRSKITEYDNGLLDEYTLIKQEVYEKEQELELKVAKLNAMKDELSYEQEMVEKLVEDKNVELAKQEENIAGAQTLSAEYSSKLQEQIELIEKLEEEERKRIEEEERKRKEEEERKRKEEEDRKKKEEEKQQSENSSNDNQGNKGGGSESSSSKTGYIWPVPASKRITSYFGYREKPTAGASTYHKGIDIGAAYGSKIVATASGKVVKADYNSVSGNYVEISHGNGVNTNYKHCSKVVVQIGDYVEQGQVIAYVGSTGVSTGPHLHLSFIVNGSNVNPLNYVSN